MERSSWATQFAMNPFPDVPRAIPQLDTFALSRRQELHHCLVHECGLGQVEHEPRTVVPQLGGDRGDVRLIDVATQPKRHSLTVGGHLDLHHGREA